MNLETYTTIGGKVILIPEKERERIRKENQKAAQDLNPARAYMRRIEAVDAINFGITGKTYKHGWSTKVGTGGPDPFWKYEMDKREKIIRTILASSPENMRGL